MTTSFAFNVGELDTEIEVEIDFDAFAAVPAAWGYHGGTPPEPAHIEINAITVLRINGNEVSESWQADADRIVERMFERSERLREAAESAINAEGPDVPDYDDYAD